MCSVSLKKLRQEHIRLLTNGSLELHCGKVCVNCGSQENIEYHHVVPLSLGGTNKFTNIVPLCDKCHIASHRGRNIKNCKKKNKGGRKSNILDKDAYKVLDKWIDGQFGNRKCAELLHIKYNSSGGGSSIKACIQYQKWCKKKGFKTVKNNLDIDVTVSEKLIDDNTIIGSIEYLDGKKENIYFHNTGLNDDILYKTRGYSKELTFKELQKRRAKSNQLNKIKK